MAKRSLISWLESHSKSVQAIGTLVTALVAIAALIGVKVQIDSAARLQQEQSARDIYREFLNISISRPEFSEPDYCALKGSSQESAYKNYVEYLLYTSEQILSVTPEWESTLAEHLGAHEQYVCSVADWSSYPANVSSMVSRMKGKICSKALIACAE